MKLKISKKAKKVAAGFSISTVIVGFILTFGSVQNEISLGTRNSAAAMENLFYDLFFKASTQLKNESSSEGKISVNSGNDPSILIVDIDEPSLTKLGNYNEWDRSTHAKVIKNLSDGGASAISFDILFKSADFGNLKANQVMSLLKEAEPEAQWDSMYPNILSHYNYDSMLVDAVSESQNSIVCYMFDEAKSYKHESQWRPLSGDKRAIEIGYESSFSNKQVDSLEGIEYKDLLDNVFPELAHAGAHIGSVNAFPDNDGIVRKISMLYRFPNMTLEPTSDSTLLVDSKIDSSRVYTTMSLMTILHLFHQKPENIKVKMGQYIDVGKPFGIYRDSAGHYATTYPNFSYPMFQALREKLKQKNLQKVASKDFADITKKITARRKSNGELVIGLFEGQVLTPEISEALFKITPEHFASVKKGEALELWDGMQLKFDEDDEQDGKEKIERFILEDTENEEEAIITPYVAKTLQFFKDSVANIPVGKVVHLSLDMDLRFNKTTKRWISNQAILSDAVIRDIQAASDEAINNLKPGEEIRFGNVKKIPIDKHGQFQVKFKGRYSDRAPEQRTFQHLSYYDVMKKRVDDAYYQGKVFILGSAAAALFDLVSAPHEENYPAVLIHSTIIKNILEDDYLTTLSESKQQIIVILLALICMILGLYFKSYISIVITVIMMTAYTFIAYRYFEGGLYIGVSKQLLAILLTNITAQVVQFYFENKEKSFINNAFKQYISPELIDAMVNNEIMPTLGGEKSNITAYFTDIASFSTFSEKIGDPSKLVELLNEYLTAMTDTLLGNKGTLDKYEGDAIIAFFGAPMPLENHAQSACDSAVDMQRKLMDLRKKWESEGDKWPKVVHDMHMRIGINSGDIVTGNMGSTMRKNYTMMGDAVNLAARLESAAKQYGAYIQISEDTQKDLTSGRFIYRSLDTVRVVGKSQPVKTFELLEKSDCKNADQLNQLVEIWESARKCYLNMMWDEAIQLFTKCLDLEPHHPDRDPGSKTTPSHVYIKRCEAYKLHPPVAEGENWDGVFTATEK